MPVTGHTVIGGELLIDYRFRQGVYKFKNNAAGWWQLIGTEWRPKNAADLPHDVLICARQHRNMDTH